jgi:hypothetical protein
MIIIGGRRYITGDFSSEMELEQVVVEHAEYIFGPDSVYLPKALVRSAAGAGSVPDGFVIDLADRRWFIVEAELAAHGVWSHIAPQVAKQLIACQQSPARELLLETVVGKVKSEPTLQDKFRDLGIADIDIRRVVTEILESPPLVAIPIDRIRKDLEEWAATLRATVRLWVIRKLVAFDDPSSVMYEIPDEYAPSLTTSPVSGGDGASLRATYDVTVGDLIEAGLLEAGSELSMTYTPRDGDTRTFVALVGADGSLTVEGRSFSSPSYAALHGIQLAGSDRRTVNGWKRWRTESGVRLADLRDRFLAERESSSID